MLHREAVEDVSQVRMVMMLKHLDAVLIKGCVQEVNT